MAETQQTNGIEVLETREWLDSLDYVLSKGGAERAGRAGEVKRTRHDHPQRRVSVAPVAAV